LRAGHEIRVLDTLAYGATGDIPDAVDFIKGSVGDTAVLAHAMAGVDRCLHLAGSPILNTPREQQASASEILAAAAEEFFSVAAKAGVPVVYASSAAVYGDGNDGAVDETAPVRPVNAHGVEKAALEAAASRAAIEHGAASIGLRMFNVYGAGQSPSSPYCGVVRLFAEKIRQREPVMIRGDGSQQRDFVYVDDAVRAIVAALGAVEDGAQVVNICTGHPVSLADLLDALRAATDLPVDVSYDEASNAGVRCSVGSPEKAVRLLGFRTRVELRDGVAAMMRELEETQPVTAVSG
jgi:UDP-glucose 4-epimerase